MLVLGIRMVYKRLYLGERIRLNRQDEQNCDQRTKE